VTIINNLFFNCDHAAMAKGGNYFTLLHNTIVHQTHQGGLDTDGAVVCLADEGTAQAAGMYLEGNILYDVEKLVRNQTNAVVVFTNNLMALPWSGPGGDNLNADPMLLHVPTLAEAANFTNWAQAQIMWAWLTPQPASLADRGGYGARHPGGVVITGEPQGVTSRTSAQLAVGINRSGPGIPAAGWPNGSGYTHYQWRLDGGAWSAETPINTPITLSVLADGPHYVEVVGKNDAGLLQNDRLLGADAAITRSRTWTVNSAGTAVRLHEILASNAGSMTHEGTTPDMVELRNEGPEINLAGLRLTDDPRNPDKFVFPAGTVVSDRGYLVLYANNADGTSGIHLGFKLNKEGGGLYLFDSLNQSGALLDAMVYGPQLPDLSVGRDQDGAWVLCQPTLGTENVPALLGDPLQLRINEWLTAETPVYDGDFVEIYNPGNLPVAMGGMFLTDNFVGCPMKHQVPALTFIPAQGYLVFKADGHAGDGPKHLNFRLSADRGEIALSTASLALVDRVIYGPQFVDQSFGRTPADYQGLATFTQPTPGSANVLVLVQPPGGALVINEVLANNATLLEPDGTTPDWVEIYNGLPSTVSLSDASLSDDIAQPRRFVFPPGTTLASGAYLRIICDPHATNAGPLVNTNFALDSSGGSLFLFDVPETGVILDTITYGLQARDFSLGRLPDGTTNWMLTIPTRGGSNVRADLGDVTRLRVNEWMPVPASGEDWFEIYNPVSLPVSLSSLYLSDSLNNRTKHQIAPLSFLGTGLGGYQVFVADGNPGAGNDHVDFKLDSLQERVVLSLADATVIDAISYYLPQTGVSEGRFPDGATNLVRFAGADSPGEPNFQRLTNVAIDEVLVRPLSSMEQAVELANLTATPVDLGGWYLSNDRKAPAKFRIPNGTLLPGNGFIVFYEHQFNPNPLDYNSFHWSPLGGEVCLSAGDSNGLTGFRATEDFGISASGVSLGRHVTSAGAADFVPLSATTFGHDNPATVADFRLGAGTNNAYPLVGPVVLSEIMYQPPDLGTNDNTRDEFIEVRNRSAGPAMLFDSLRPTNTWRLRNAVDFDFPAITLPAGGYLVVVRFDPTNDLASLAAFRAAYRLGTNVPVLGPFTGKLANDSDTIELKRPDAPISNTVPYIMVEKVHYSDSAPWPLVAPNMGVALRRVNLSAYANDPTNWVAAAPTPGFAGGGDADGDGLPDDWEWSHGLAPTIPGDAALDADGDGMSNWQEYLAGTDPTDPQSALRLAPVAGTGTNALQLNFAAPAGVGYTIQQRTNLVLGTWQKYLDVEAAGTNRVIQINVPPSGAAKFYRVVTPKQP
jgi:hypothetical protein